MSLQILICFHSFSQKISSPLGGQLVVQEKLPLDPILNKITAFKHIYFFQLYLTLVIVANLQQPPLDPSLLMAWVTICVTSFSQSAWDIFSLYM